MVEPQPSKLMTWVRFPLPAPGIHLAADAARCALYYREERVREVGQTSAHVAQLVEHVLGKDEVSGSIPLVGSIDAPVRDGGELIA